MTITDLDFVEILKSFMEKWDLGNSGVAKALRAHPNTISNYLNGTTKPSEASLGMGSLDPACCLIELIGTDPDVMAYPDNDPV